MPAPVMHVEVKGHGAPRPQVEDRAAGEKLQAQLQLAFPAAHGEEEGMVHPVGAEAQHQRQLRAQGGGDDGGRGGLEPGPLRKDEARLERNDPWGRGAPATPCLRPAEAQPLEDVHICRGRAEGERARSGPAPAPAPSRCTDGEDSPPTATPPPGAPHWGPGAWSQNQSPVWVKDPAWTRVRHRPPRARLSEFTCDFNASMSSSIKWDDSSPKLRRPSRGVNELPHMKTRAWHPISTCK